MKNTTHTPGPWAVATGPIQTNEFGEKFKTINFSENEINCVDVYANIDECEETLTANARLIAAAPDMLECLLMFDEFEKVETYSPKWEELASKHMEMVSVAINKATS